MYKVHLFALCYILYLGSGSSEENHERLFHHFLRT